MDINRYCFHHRNIVRVFDPAVVFSVCFKCTRELSWTPAVNWVPNKLTRADQHSKND